MKAKNLYYLILILLGTVLNLNAQNPTVERSAFDHLLTVNAEWDNHKDVLVNNVKSFENDEERIAFHLTEVISHLSQHPSSLISNKALSNRNQLLDKLQSYADAKVFPQNTFHAQRQPYFIDIYGTHCAVGYLIQTSGNEALAQKIKSEQNYDYIKDIKTEGVQAWADEFGFTTEELAWIQPGYAPTLPINTLEGGTNGEVKTMFRYNSIGDFYIGGTFDTLNDLPCLNIGVYRNNQLECLGDGITGTVNEIYTKFGEPLFVTGLFNYQGTQYSLATFDVIEGWQYINIETREGALSNCVAYNLVEDVLELSIVNPFDPSISEVWQMDEEGNWTKKMSVIGVINDMYSRGGHEFIYGGQFDIINVFNGTEPDTQVNVNNVAFKNETTWYGIEGEISDEVNVIYYYGNTLFFGGTCSSEVSSVCLTRYFNGVLQPMIFGYYFNGVSSEKSINDIIFNQDVLYFAGEFSFSPVIGTYGSGLGTYSLTTNYIEMLADFDEPVNCLYEHFYDIYIGGAFTENLSNEINYLAHVDFASSTSDIIDEKALTIYPNPVRETINIKGLDEPFSYTIYDLSGRLVTSQNRIGYNVDLPSMESGIYLLNVVTQDGKSQTLKFVKE